MTQPTTDHQQAFDRLRQVRAEALEHMRKAQQLARERRDLIRQLIDEGLSQADIARELGVTRQAIQKMLACLPARCPRESRRPRRERGGRRAATPPFGLKIKVIPNGGLAPAFPRRPRPGRARR
jgi:DNA-binding XRE family transcriptional regulator